MDWTSTGIMFGWYASILVVIGATGAVRVLAFSNGPGANNWSALALRRARLIMPLVFIALLARLWLQTWQAFGSDQPLTLAHAVIIITETPWGAGWAWQLAASLAAWITIAMVSPRRWGVLLLAAAALGGSVGFTGHAAGADAYVSMVITAHGRRRGSVAARQRLSIAVHAVRLCVDRQSGRLRRGGAVRPLQLARGASVPGCSSRRGIPSAQHGLA